MKRSSPMLVSLISAAATSVLLLSATAAPAQTGGAFHAKPVTAATAGKIVVRDTVWRCTADGCASTTKGSSRPAIVCESLVKQVGAVESFHASGQAFDAAALAKCNAKA